MWCAISKLCTKENQSDPSASECEPIDPKRMEPQDTTQTYDTIKSKYRASVKWLLSKAFNNKIPENLREPFYRDHENQEHLKPQISGALANAELYCLALGHIYSDPNYHNLNHWAILQTLSRKGVYDQDNPETEITETILIQTNPLKMNAHMAVIESIMVLYGKEVASSDQICTSIQRIGGGQSSKDEINSISNSTDPEHNLLTWLNKVCRCLQQRIDQEFGSVSGDIRAEGDRRQPIKLPTSMSNLKDLSDGVALAALISFYCPDDLPWCDIRVSYIASVQESLHNLMMVFHFCQQNLPSSVFHMMPEDITYMRSSMKQNLIVFLADLYNVLEIHPVKCVKYPGMDRPNIVPRNLSANNSTLKKSVIYQSDSQFSEDSLFRRDSEESFVVHRNRVVPTLSSVIQSNATSSVDEPLLPARLRPSKEKQNYDTKAEERGDASGSRNVAAGRPSHWEDSRKSSYAGRRSRRNSFSDDSQLTIENFGGSQDHLNFIGRNPDKDLGGGVLQRKISLQEPYQQQETVKPCRSSIQDARGSIQLSYDEFEKQDTEREKSDKMKRSSENLRKLSKDEELVRDFVDGEVNNKLASFADLSAAGSKVVGDQKGIHIVYMQHEKDDTIMPSKSSLLNKKSGQTNGNGGGSGSGSSNEKKTSFATLPNTTTWQQQSSSNQLLQQQHQSANEENQSSGGNNAMSSQLNNIRMKLEEKRRHIESEKRRMELIMSKQRQKVGKAAFLQAVTKIAQLGKNNVLKGAGESETDGDNTQTMVSECELTEKPQRPFTLKEISDDAETVEHKWLDTENGAPFVETRKTPDIENMDLEQYQQSLAMMNHSLHDIQADIQRLASQQNQIQHQNLLAQQQQLQAAYVAQQQYQHYASQHNITQQAAHLNQMHNMFSSASHIPQQPMHHNIPQQQPQHQQPVSHHPETTTQFYLHDQSPQQPQQRRTWSQQTSPLNHQHNSLQSQRSYSNSNNQQLGSPSSDIRTWGSNKPHTLSQQHLQDIARYQNGDQNHVSYTVNQPQPLFSGFSTPSSSPQHRNLATKTGVHRQISHMLSGGGGDGPVNLKQMEHQDRTLTRSASIIHAPIPVPDDMEPQNISFIGNSDQISEGLNRLNITSGTRTYRIPSPTRPSLSRNSFQSPDDVRTNNEEQERENEKGFYISFDNDQPKRPKPPLRVKRGSPKKERSGLEDDLIVPSKRGELYQSLSRQPSDTIERPNRRDFDQRLPSPSLNDESRINSISNSPATFTQTFREPVREPLREKSPSAIIIGKEPDPNSLDEMEKKKEKIMLLSLQRRQQQEEAKARKEADTAIRREQDKAKEEERIRKKEEQAQRRQLILEQYKLKKAIEEAEREGKILDKEFINAVVKPIPKLRGKTTGRPRPKTIHVDTGSVELAEGMLTPSRGKKGSTSNLTNTNSYNPSSMRRDYYRGSHDSLADTGIHSASSLYRGSSSDQDSMMYRYGDTDSGLGRATPPRRAPSPGMGPMRHLPSPSGPGSLPPGLMTKRRMFDDGCSDISSTPSSMMDYSGPRLYKQPATKSNRGIMLNAVEYCVFPGVVNKEAKRRVLDEIARSESKHFLILFRDAGCQFRALYSYCPEREEITKLYGTGPKQVNDRMFDKFFKYNSGGKCFSQIHTKHLTVTIDAFTIHNSLWQGKKVNLPNKKDMALVI